MSQNERRASAPEGRAATTLSVLSRLALHLPRPAQKAQKLPPLRPQKSKHIPGGQRLGAPAGVGLHPPAQIFAPPRRQPVAARRIPQESQSCQHVRLLLTSIPTRGAAVRYSRSFAHYSKERCHVERSSSAQADDRSRNICSCFSPCIRARLQAGREAAKYVLALAPEGSL